MEGFENPERAANEKALILAAQKMRRYNSRYRKDYQHQMNGLKTGWSSIWLTKVVTTLITVLLECQNHMSEKLLKAVEFLTTDLRIEEHVKETGLPPGTVRKLLSVIINGSYKKVVCQLLGFLAQTPQDCRKAAARALENDLGAMDGEILEKHVLLFDLAIGFQIYMTDVTMVKSFVAHVVRTATVPSGCSQTECNGSAERAIRILKKMFIRGEEVEFELNPPLANACVGTTTSYASILKLFLDYDFLHSQDNNCFHNRSKTEALKFLASFNWKDIQQDAIICSKKKIFDGLHECLVYIDKPDREVVYEMMKKLLEIKDVTLFHRDGNGNALNESQFYVCKIILWALEKRYYWDNHEVLKLCLAVNIPFLDDFLFVDTFVNLTFGRAHGVIIQKIFLFARIYRREDIYCHSDYYDKKSIGSYKGRHLNRIVPVEERLTTNQVLMILEILQSLYTPDKYLGSSEWDFLTLQQVLHLFSVLLREVSFGNIPRANWDQGEYCTKMGIAMLRRIMNPGFLEEGSDLFPNDIPMFDDQNTDPMLRMAFVWIGEEIRKELTDAAKKALTSRDEAFENLLNQIVSFLELSLTVTDREVIESDNFVKAAKPCVEGLIPYFSLLACRLSVALTRAYLDPAAQIYEDDFHVQSAWVENFNVAIGEMVNVFPKRLNFTNSMPRASENRIFLFEKKLGDNVYNNHLIDSEEFWDWLAVRAFALESLDDKDVYTTED